MTDPIDIHPDFHGMPAMKSVSRPWLVAAINACLQLAGALKWLKFRGIARRHTLSTPGGGRIPVWVIRPGNLRYPAPALVYLHGSGFMVKHVPQHIENAVHYAREAECCVLFVDYRLAPRYRFPIPLHDCYAALAWAGQNAAELGIDPNRIAVGGDSAGGALAASVAQKAAREGGTGLCGQLLIYPITDCRCETFSSTAFADVPPFKQFSMPAVWEAYLGQPPGANPPRYVSPMHGDTRGLPPAYVETEEYDPWRDEGRAYAEALREHGVDVEFHEIKGAVHGFDAFAPGSAVVQDALRQRVRFLRRLFH